MKINNIGKAGKGKERSFETYMLSKLTKEEACNANYNHLTTLIQELSVDELDMSVTEFLIRKSFENGVAWAKAIHIEENSK